MVTLEWHPLRKITLDPPPLTNAVQEPFSVSQLTRFALCGIFQKSNYHVNRSALHFYNGRFSEFMFAVSKDIFPKYVSRSLFICDSYWYSKTVYVTEIRVAMKYRYLRLRLV